VTLNNSWTWSVIILCFTSVSLVRGAGRAAALCGHRPEGGGSRENWPAASAQCTLPAWVGVGPRVRPNLTPKKALPSAQSPTDAGRRVQIRGKAAAQQAVASEFEKLLRLSPIPATSSLLRFVPAPAPALTDHRAFDFRQNSCLHGVERAGAVVR
jgi:hypothetical protein